MISTPKMFTTVMYEGEECKVIGVDTEARTQGGKDVRIVYRNYPLWVYSDEVDAIDHDEDFSGVTNDDR